MHTRKLFLVRHGSIDNPNGVSYRRLPGFPLNDTGTKQAAQAGQFLSDKNLEVIFHSPLERTSQTAEIISKSNGSIPLITEPHINEWDSWESYDDVISRMLEFWQKWLADDWQVGAMVSHRDPIRFFMTHLKNPSEIMLHPRSVLLSSGFLRNLFSNHQSRF